MILNCSISAIYGKNGTFFSETIAIIFPFWYTSIVPILVLISFGTDQNAMEE